MSGIVSDGAERVDSYSYSHSNILHEGSRLCQRSFAQDPKATTSNAAAYQFPISHTIVDEKFNAKIVDFGLATLLTQDDGYVTTAVAGTIGYLAPKYFTASQLTEKVDIYSFGVLVMEVISGKRCIDMTRSEYSNLLDWAWKLHEEDNLSDLLDFRLHREGTNGEIARVMCANSCIYKRAIRRRRVGDGIRRVL
eukprot:Gb_41005 [translate_table: standard]